MSKETDDLRFGILGTANIATKVCKAMHAAKGVKPRGIASRSIAKARAWGKKHKVAKAFGSYEEMLADPTIDAIYIPLPNSMHHRWTLRAADAGKHVLCEKPLGSNYQQALEMAEACQKAGVIFMDGVFWVHHIRAAHLRKLLDRKALGDLRRVTSSFTFCWDKWPEENIRMKSDLAGGSLGDLGWYCVRLSWFVFQEIPKRVYATARYHNGVDVNLSAVMWYEGQRMASFDCGFDTVMRQWFEIAGTKGSAVCDDFVLPNSTAKSRYFLHDGTGKKGKEFTFGRCVQEKGMIEDFAQAVRKGKVDDQPWIKDALVTQRVVDALARSAELGTPVDIKPSKGT